MRTICYSKNCLNVASTPIMKAGSFVIYDLFEPAPCPIHYIAKDCPNYQMMRP
jgi:hypothetical protein